MHVIRPVHTVLSSLTDHTTVFW